jgi:hypothetical protein
MTSLACAWLLLRAFQRTRARLLLWTGLCFMALAANNVLLFVDLVLLPNTIDLWALRTALGVLGLGTLLFGLIWHSE